MGPTKEAKRKGYTINLFVDAKTGKYIEEFATSNFVMLTKPDEEGKRSYITPKSNSILPSITNRSLSELAALHFGWKVVRRRVRWDELVDGEFDEIAACGTAVVITPVGEIDRQVPVSPSNITQEEEQVLEDISTMWTSNRVEPELKMEKVVCNSEFEGFKALYTTYRQIQYGQLPDKFEWMYPPQGI